MTAHNLLTEPLIRFETHEGLQHGSLPDVFAALMSDVVESFPALRAHQEPAWHMFLAQLGAIAAHRAGLTAPPDDAATWQDIIGQLTRAEFPADEPWCLVVDDDSKPAFLQPPVPEGVRLEKRAPTPDAVDMLITSRNHDLKQTVGLSASLDDWIFALVSLQTMEGYGGGGGRLNGIARMNKGSSSRVLMSLTPIASNAGELHLRAGRHLSRDISQLLLRREKLSKQTPIPYPHADGLALTWTARWPEGEQLSLDGLDIWFVEVCRRVRLRTDRQAIWASTGNSSSERIKAKHLNGVVGDPWAPVHRLDSKTLTIGVSGNFHYKRIVDLLSEDWQLPLLAELGDGEADAAANWLLTVAAIARGNTETGGFKSRVIPLRGRVARGLMARRKELHQLATVQIREIKKLDVALRNALALANAGGDREKINQDSYALTQLYRDRLDIVADRNFFNALWSRFEAEQFGNPDDVEKARRDYLLPLIDTARDLLKEGLADIPCPSIRRPRAEARARRRFNVQLRNSEKDGFPDLFANDETVDEEITDAA